MVEVAEEVITALSNLVLLADQAVVLVFNQLVRVLVTNKLIPALMHQ
tara:strand:+ start:156 stop:296 length:141 start_codon:yes stop_codon:yes gene_type:complete